MHETVTKLFLDCADLNEINKFKSNKLISGFTTNPSLMRNAGVENYLSFAQQIIELVRPLPLSLEVFADDDQEIYRQAKVLSNMYENLYVKIPVTTTKGILLTQVAERLNNESVKLNLTAIMTVTQISAYTSVLNKNIENIFSIFCGRLADSGTDPVPVVKESIKLIEKVESWRILWASPREIFNLIQAKNVGCHLITMTPELWKKLPLLGKNPEIFSLETVQMFHRDALAAKYWI